VVVDHLAAAEEGLGDLAVAQAIGGEAGDA
jgi:hypothetical protein